MTAPVAGAVAKKAAGKAGTKAAGRKAAARRRPPAGGRPNLNDLAPGEVEQELQQRRRIAAAKSAAEPEATDEGSGAAAPAPTSSGAGAVVAMPAAAATGSGFLLGVFAWALGLAYLRGGSAEVRRFMAAKFFNKVEATP